MSDCFNEEWAKRKLDMPRRRRELEAYVAKWLPELMDMEPGLVLDIGSSVGDFLAIAREAGHDVLGIDKYDPSNAMGDAYCQLAAEQCRASGIPVYPHGLTSFLESDMPDELNGRCAVVHSRGSIEQSLEECMVGPPHREHHRADMLDWIKNDKTIGCFTSFCRVSATLLRSGGLLLIAANGTRETNEFYDYSIRCAASGSGLKLKKQDGMLVHLWENP